MATQKISAMTAANTIDAANDYMPIVQSGNNKKINRNVLLGLSSAPLGTTDTQSPTNKTFDNTNQLTVKGTKLTLQDDSDTSKQAQFLMSSITTANTRSYTLPDASTTIVGTGTTQTLTNKTLTSPTINGGTLDNATITVDSIAGHSVGTTVTVANLQIASGVLNSANAVTSTSIATGAVQPLALVAGTGSGWAWSTWSPTWSNLTTGNGTQVARYIQMGKTVVGQINFTFGTTSSISGSVTFTLPVTSVSSYLSANPIGMADCFNTGVASFSGTVSWATTTTALIQVANVASTYATDTVLSSTIPFAWTTGSRLALSIMYEAA